jgi:hypothetical protein
MVQLTRPTNSAVLLQIDAALGGATGFFCDQTKVRSIMNYSQRMLSVLSIFSKESSWESSSSLRPGWLVGNRFWHTSSAIMSVNIHQVVDRT